MLQPGDRIGRFEIQRRLGRGGMATVYVAHDPNLGRLVALKMFEGDLDGGDAGEKFLREARAAAALNHPHIVTIHDFGEFASQPFIVMEYLQGDTLAALIKRKEPLPLAERLRLIEEICSGVAYAHGFDVIHRDIKPANLVRERTGRLKILDFGIARTLGSSMSRGTALVGTPGYMAPEQIHGGQIDRRADLFSIGVVAYELLSYAEAFSGDSLPAISHRVLHHEPVALTSLDPEIPVALAEVVAKALKKNPAERYADAESMQLEFAQIRRQFSGDLRFDAPTLIAPRTAPSDRVSDPGFRAGRGSGSGKPSSGPGTPNTARQSRDELQRRRLVQIDASLAAARVQLDAGRHSAALEACMNALALDENHAVALALEHDIRSALARRQAAALVADARKELQAGRLTVAQANLDQARELDGEGTEVRQLERDLRLARAEQQGMRQRADVVRGMLDNAEEALKRGDIESALASAREAVRLDPANDLAREMETEARRRLNRASGFDSGDLEGQLAAAGAPKTIAVPSSPALRNPPKGANKTGPVPDRTPGPSPVQLALKRASESASAGWQTLTQACRSGSSAVRGYAQRAAAAVGATADGGAPGRAASTKRPTRIPWAIGGGALVAAVAVGVLMWPSAAPVTPPAKAGTVTIDASPWATVTAIVAQDGTTQSLPADATTPLSLQLPAGTYRVTLAGPLSGGAPQEIQIVVDADRTNTAPDVRFTTLTAEDYFEPYLATQTDAGPGQRVAGDGAKPPGSETR